MRTPDEGLQYISRFLDADPELAIVMSSALKDFYVVREAMRLGAADYVVKDFDSDELLHTLDRVLEKKSLLQRERRQNNENLVTHRQNVLVGEGPAIQNLRKAIEKVQVSSANVVIFGETGTGKGTRSSTTSEWKWNKDP